jgi:hypothetical protein
MVAGIGSNGAADSALVFTSSTLVTGDSIASAFSGSLTRAVGESAASYVINQGSVAAANYSITYASGTFTINKAAVTITGLTALNKVYDGVLLASTSGRASLSGVIGNDKVTLGGTPVFAFANANVGSGISILGSGYTISGFDAGNYTLIQPTGLTANITAAALTITGLTASNKVYDKATTATATGTAALSGVISGDSLTLAGTPVFTFASSNVGAGISVTSSGYTISGTSAPAPRA